MDCRLFPLDIIFLDNNCYWALFKYEKCSGSIEKDLNFLLKYKNEVISQLGDEIHDYATFPVPGMDRIGYKILSQISY
jgi:hypothetical protein